MLRAILSLMIHLITNSDPLGYIMAWIGENVSNGVKFCPG